MIEKITIQDILNLPEGNNVEFKAARESLSREVFYEEVCSV